MNPMGSKTKIAIGVAAILGVAALGLMVLSHKSAASAQAQDDSGAMGGYPNLLFAPSAGPAQIATGSSMQSDATTGIPAAPDGAASSIMAALAAAQAQITANTNTAYNTNATGIMRDLPAALASAGLTDITASQQQAPDGTTSLAAHATYRKELTGPGYAFDSADAQREFLRLQNVDHSTPQQAAEQVAAGWGASFKFAA